MHETFAPPSIDKANEARTHDTRIDRRAVNRIGAAVAADREADETEPPKDDAHQSKRTR